MPFQHNLAKNKDLWGKPLFDSPQYRVFMLHMTALYSVNLGNISMETVPGAVTPVWRQWHSFLSNHVKQLSVLLFGEPKPQVSTGAEDHRNGISGIVHSAP